jgi:anti-sigma B factor antagonist
MPDEQAVAIQPNEQVIWAVIQPSRLDERTAEQMQSDVLAAATKRPKIPVVLDLANIEFLPSLALGALVSMNRNLKSEGHRFMLVGIQPMVRGVFSLTRMDKLFEIHPSVDEALEHLHGA